MILLKLIFYLAYPIIIHILVHCVRIMVSGRPSDPTRSFFLKVEGSKARCIDCNSLVSNKIERLRNHRKHCHSLSSSTHLEPDLIFESSPQPSPLKRPKTCQPQM